MADATLTSGELAVIELIAAGLTRWAIAEELNLSENSVRTVIRRLCEHYSCSMRELPAKAGWSEEDDTGAFL